MGQAPSIPSVPAHPHTTTHSHRSKSKSTLPISPPMLSRDTSSPPHNLITNHVLLSSPDDYISTLPDECLACIFQSLSSGDRTQCSLVCRRWLQVEGQSRHRLSLNARSDLLPEIPVIFNRFDSVTKLALKCDRKSTSIGDDGLVLISLHCRNLTRLKLRACRELTDAGMAVFARNCKGLKKLSCGSCTFGAKGMNAILDNCSSLEELTVKRLRGITDGAAPAEPIGPGAAATSLKTIYLKELYNGMVEIHLERLQVSDTGVTAISNCMYLEILHLVKTPECTNLGLKAVAENCKLLRKLHIDGWKTNRIGDDGLISVAKNCPNLQELVLIGLNPTRISLELIAANCQNLERLALCGSETVGDAEISCIAAKCIALKKLCIKSCPVSNCGIEALAGGCPNLVKVKLKKCRGVTGEGADWLRTSRGSLAVNLDTHENEHQDASASDSNAHDNGLEMPPLPVAIQGVGGGASSSTGRSMSFKARLGLTAGRNLMVCTFRRWSSFTSGSRNT